MIEAYKTYWDGSNFYDEKIINGPVIQKPEVQILSKDVLLLIFSHLNWEEQKPLSLVSRQFYHVSQSEGLWYATAAKIYGYSGDKILKMLSCLSGWFAFPKKFKEFPEDLKNQKRFISKALQENIEVIEFLPEKFKTNKHCAHFIFEQLSLKYKSSFEVKFEQVKNILSHFPSDVKEDETIILKAIEINHCFFESASEKLKTDQKFIFAAGKINPKIIKFVSSDLRSDRNFILGFLSNLRNFDDKSDIDVVGNVSHDFLSYLPINLRDDSEVVWLAVEKLTGFILDHASERLKNNEEFIRECIEKNPWSLKYASAKQKDDEEIVFSAVKKAGGLLHLQASQRLLEKRDFILRCTKAHASSIEDQWGISERWVNDKEILLTALAKDIRIIFEFPSSILPEYKEYALKVLELDICKAPPSMKRGYISRLRESLEKLNE